MTPQAAVGTGLGGLAAAGAGGTGIAYMAGAFETTSTYLTQAKEDVDIKGKKEYIGGNKAEITKLLTENTKNEAYQTALDEVWDDMSDVELKKKESGLNKPVKGDIKTEGKSEDVAVYINDVFIHLKKHWRNLLQKQKLIKKNEMLLKRLVFIPNNLLHPLELNNLCQLKQ
ncbi:hypothetical protein [Candidatus Mycoplasma haematohominis]|uniref:Uncharacterized protein n=1 Tax=Candidatus Mycoplasma haematohominis TaxID=1494318 RepID=A0A478FR48_9MOLU|nr:hypothetical protein [Candidatus Mycoplasma haemohominis]GCE63892.1 hypothetical protein MHSWG343_08990 [Candidatus Mycoplasma haemohominis]